MLEALQGATAVFKQPVMIAFHFTMPRKGALDASNCAYMAKMIEDCMVDHGMIEDDNVNFVKGIHLTNTVVQKKEPAVMVLVATASDLQNLATSRKFLGFDR